MVAAPCLLAGGLALAGGSHRANPSFTEVAVDPTAGDPSKLSPQEMMVRSRQMTMQSATTEQRVGTLLKRAETKRDMVMVNCVSDKLVQLRGYIALANGAGQQMTAAIDRNDDGARIHQFERQSIAYQKVLVLGTEAEGCVGQDVSYVGSTVVIEEIDPSIPQQDPTIPVLPVPSTDRPPEGDCPSA